MYRWLDWEDSELLARMDKGEAVDFPDSELLAYEDRFNTQEGLCIYCGCEEEPENLTDDDWQTGWCDC